MAVLPASGPGQRFPQAAYDRTREVVWRYGVVYLDLSGPGDELLLTDVTDKLILEGDEAPFAVRQFRPGAVSYAGANVNP